MNCYCTQEPPLKINIKLLNVRATRGEREWEQYLIQASVRKIINNTQICIYFMNHFIECSQLIEILWKSQKFLQLLMHYENTRTRWCWSKRELKSFWWIALFAFTFDSMCMWVCVGSCVYLCSAHKWSVCVLSYRQKSVKVDADALSLYHFLYLCLFYHQT